MDKSKEFDGCEKKFSFSDITTYFNDRYGMFPNNIEFNTSKANAEIQYSTDGGWITIYYNSDPQEVGCYTHLKDKEEQNKVFTSFEDFCKFIEKEVSNYIKN